MWPPSDRQRVRRGVAGGVLGGDREHVRPGLDGDTGRPAGGSGCCSAAAPAVHPRHLGDPDVVRRGPAQRQGGADRAVGRAGGGGGGGGGDRDGGGSGVGEGGRPAVGGGVVGGVRRGVRADVRGEPDRETGRKGG